MNTPGFRMLSRSTRRVDEAASTSQFERILANAARGSLVLIGFVILVVALQAGQVILAPLFLAITVGLMFGPVADAIEKFGVPKQLSAAAVVLLLVFIILGGIALFAVPLSNWVGRAPVIWARLQEQLMNWREPLEALAALQNQIKGVLGGGGDTVAVTVQDGSAVANFALIFPAIAAQMLIFLASLYFFMASRDQIRISVLALCVTRRMRWRSAHIFKDVEQKVSRFLLSVSFINLCVGTAVSLAMWVIGMPTPILWGALAAVLNYIPYVGQAVMMIILLSVGLGTRTGLENILLPVGCYLVISFIEGQIATPHFLGRRMTINPFLIFLSITFWLWVWGPVGGLVAVPSLLIITSALSHILPAQQEGPRRPVRGTMSEKDRVLANAAATIREKAGDQERLNGLVEANRQRMGPIRGRRGSPPDETPPEGLVPNSM